MIKAAPLTDKNLQAFKSLFARYYAELDCGEDVPHLIDEYILPDLLAGLIKIELLEDGAIPAGFVIYQIDDIDNEWNFKEGWGDIREIYVLPELRRRGLGRFLLYAAEMKLKESGALKAYCLPYEKSVPFFAACGYEETDGYCDDLDCRLFEKLTLDNRCK